jgi:hypothetical protein
MPEPKRTARPTPAPTDLAEAFLNDRISWRYWYEQGPVENRDYEWLAEWAASRLATDVPA